MKKIKLGDALASFADYISQSDLLSIKILNGISLAIIKERLNKNMNQCEFSKYMNVSQAMVSKWENNDCNFTIKNLAEIAEKLDLDLVVELKEKIPASNNSYTHFKNDSTNDWFYTAKNMNDLEQAV